MARSLIAGLLAADWDPARLAVADPDPAQRELLRRFAGVQIEEDNARAVAGARLVVIAVKPQIASQALAQAGAALGRERPLLLSIAAGVRIASLEAAVGGPAAIVRAMPNTPALVGRGISAFFANARVDELGRKIAVAVLQAVGEVLEVDTEEQLDAVTAVSGSGPAYFFFLVEALADAAAAAGLPRDSAARLAAGTGIGAMALLAESGESPAALRARVTSPGGTTAAALEVLSGGGFAQLVERAVARATARARELGKG